MTVLIKYLQRDLKVLLADENVSIYSHSIVN